MTLINTSINNYKGLIYLVQIIVGKRKWQVRHINSAFAWCQTPAHTERIRQKL